MSYSTPKQWAEGDTVPAAELAKYSDGLTAIRPMIGETVRNWVQLGSADTQQFWLVHKARWLIYKSTGVVRHHLDPVTYPDVTLSDAEEINAFDLDAGVSWLAPGMLYTVEGCSVAYEDETGVMV